MGTENGDKYLKHLQIINDFLEVKRVCCRMHASFPTYNKLGVRVRCPLMLM